MPRRAHRTGAAAEEIGQLFPPIDPACKRPLPPKRQENDAVANLDTHSQNRERLQAIHFCRATPIAPRPSHHTGSALLGLELPPACSGNLSAEAGAFA